MFVLVKRILFKLRIYPNIVIVMKFYFSLLACILLFTTQLTGQVLKSKEAKSLVPEAKQIRINQQSGNIEIIEFDRLRTAQIQESNFSEYLKNTLNLGAGYTFKATKEFIDQLGEQHIRYQQMLNNIPVEGMEFIGHFRNGTPVRANGQYTNNRAQITATNIQSDVAFAKAKNAVPSKKYALNDAELSKNFQMVYIVSNGSLKLCYKFDIYSITPLDRKFIYVDASTGNIIKMISRIHDADKVGTANTLYSGQQNITADSLTGFYRLMEIGRADSIYTYNLNGTTNYYSALDVIDDDNIWDSTDNNFNAAYDVHWGTEMTFDYFFSMFGRNSFDGNGAALISYFNYGINVNNAFWDGERMTYGQGDGYSYLPFTSIDIIAHEITHGLTQHSANLEYAYESGALNESFSDIFGILVDFYANPSTANWQMAEQISLTGNPIRSMSDPNSMGDPDTYLGNFWVTGSSDYGGVHTNSGVSNYWFYLLAEGGSGTNDNGQPYNIAGIGLEKAAAIAYRNLTVYLTQFSQYHDARTYSIQSAIDLYGSCSQEVISVTNAWNAVGVGGTFENAVIASFNLSQDFSCTYPVEITAFNTSINSDSIKWYRNDIYVGDHDSLPLDYTSVGYYDIKLIAFGAATCGTTDTLEVDSAIYISDAGSPVNAQCSPLSRYQYYEGISYFELGTIKNTSFSSAAQYEDFTCTKQTRLTAGKYYPFRVNTLSNYGEIVYIWLDLNNNGIFENNEKLYETLPGSIHSGSIIIPAVANYDTPLRLRIGSDRQSYLLTDACTQPNYGHYEDYTVFVAENTQAPLANFSGSPLVNGTNEQISFWSTSENIPTTYHWTFEGGTPATSTVVNPQVFYSSIGEYDVELIVTNQYGSDTVLKTDFISITDEYNMGDQDSTYSASGKIYDSGGKNGNYSNSENLDFVINPPCADSIKLDFNQIYLETCCDRIRVYDGDKYSGILLWTSSNNTIPNQLVATSGTMTINFTSDGSVTRTGFEAYWQTVFTNGLLAPVAEIHISPELPPFNTPVQFSDSSQNDPYSWIWNINDEYFSFERNTVYKFVESGDKSIELIVTNCHSTDTTQETVTIQLPPEQHLGIQQYSDTLEVGDSILISIPVTNLSANGDLVVFMEEIGIADNSFTQKDYSIKVSGVNNIDNQLSEYSYTAHYLSNVELQGLKILLPEQSGFINISQEFISRGAAVDYLVYLSNVNLNDYDLVLVDDRFQSYILDNEIFDYVNSGGDIIIAGDNTLAYYNSILSLSGIQFNGTSCQSGSFNTIYQHKLTQDIFSYQIGDGVLASLTASGNAEKLIDDQYGRTYSALSAIGRGNVLVLSNEAFHDSFYIYSGHLQLLNNYLTYCLGGSGALGIELIDDYLYIEETTTDSLKVKIKTENTIGGHYENHFNITSNDTANEQTIFPVSILLIGEARASYDTNWIDFGLSYVNTEYTKTLYVENVGTDTLFIDSIRFTGTDFSAFDSAYKLSVGEGLTYNISHLPSTNRTYEDTLFIYSNSFEDSVHFIRLTAYSEHPPIISASPDTIIENMFTNDSTEYQIEIKNIGNSPLILHDFYLETPVNSSYITQKILDGVKILNYSASLSNDFIQRINQLGGIYSYSGYLSNDLIDTVDVIIMDANSYLSSNQISIIRDYVSQGGGVLLADDYAQTNFNQVLSGTGLSFNDAGSCWSGLAPYLADHEITNNLDSIYIGYYNSASSEINVDTTNGSGIALVKDNGNNVYSAAVNHGIGRIVTIADRVLQYYSVTNYDFELKCIEWLGNMSNWIKLENYKSDTLLSGESFTINVELNATNLYSGIYQKNIVITNNDPENEKFSIPITLNVTGIGIITLSEEQITFDTTFVNYFSKDSLFISNVGTEVLNISNIASDNSAFGVSAKTLAIEPYSTQGIEIIYNPLSENSHTGTLSLHSNAKDKPVTVVQLSGNAILPPAITANPNAYNVITNPNKIVQQTLSIGNDSGKSNLKYNINLSNTGNRTGDYLTDAQNLLNDRYSEVNSLIPNRFNFTHGISGYYISDGGSDMYDGGNYIYLNDSYNYIYYSDNQISYLSNYGRYFTKKVDGLFVFVGELENTTSFHVRGDLGSYPGSSDYTEIERGFGQKSYKGYVARMYDYYNPSVNHLIIVEDQENSYQSFTLSGDDYYHNIYNLDSNAIVHHLLFANENGYYTSNDEMESIMDAYLAIINPVPEWISVEKNQGNIPAGEIEELNFTINTDGLEFGNYSASIDIYNNDPENEIVSIPVTLEVVNNRAPELISNLTDRIIEICQNQPLNLKEFITDPDNDLLIYNIGNTNNDVVFPQIKEDSLFYFNPMNLGVSTIELTISDGLNQPLIISFDIQVREGNKVQLLEEITDINIAIDAQEHLIDLKDYFSDPDGDELTYEIIVSNETIIAVDIITDYVQIQPLNEGNSIITIIASDGKCGSLSESFILNVLGVSNIRNVNTEAFSIYPNPARDVIILENKSLGIIDGIIIYDMKGTNINISYETDVKNNVIIDISSLETGAYVMKIIAKDRTNLLRFIKE